MAGFDPFLDIACFSSCRGASAGRILDNLPVAIAKLREENGQPVKTYERGFPVGSIAVRFCCLLPQRQDPLSVRQLPCLAIQEDGRFFLNNHLRFTILYHRDIETDLARIVGFEVEPFSVKHKYDGKWEDDKPTLKSCNPGSMKFVTDDDEKQELKEGQEIIFTYDVSFKVGALLHSVLPTSRST